jgi:putative ABC transport system ATP-binding protein
MDQLTLTDITKAYKTGPVEVLALSHINLSIKKGEMLAIMGPSGSGKSTLMHIIGLLDTPTSGNMYIDGVEVGLSLPDKKLARLRSEKVGFVFQAFNLLPRLSALQNVLLPTNYFHGKTSQTVSRAKQLLVDLGLEHRMNHKPNELSGGEKQRVAIARSLMNNPDIILADEPTGNLDSKSGQEVLDILSELNRSGKTVVVITHDINVAHRCENTIHLLDGKIVEGELRL